MSETAALSPGHHDTDLPDATCIQPLPNAVSVRGLDPGTSRDTVKNYFQLKKRSGGGPVIDVLRVQDITQNVVYVVFGNPDDAKNVADPARSHSLAGRLLDVKLCSPPSTLNNYLLMSNLPEFSSTDHFKLMLESLSGKEVDFMRFDPQTISAVVKMHEDGIETLKASIPHKEKLKQVTMERVINSGVLLVRDLPPAMSEEDLMLYFESLYDDTSVDMHGDFALITFDKPEEAVQAADQDHSHDGHPLTVTLYLPCLGTTGGVPELPFPIPPPLTLPSDKAEKVVIVNQDGGLRDRLAQALKLCFAVTDTTDPDRVSLCCTVTQDTEGGREEVKRWQDQALKTLDQFLEALTFEELALQQEEYNAGKADLEREAGRECMAVIYRPEEERLIMVVESPQQQALVDKVKVVVQTVRDRVYRHRHQETRTKSLVPQIKTLIQHDIHDLQRQFEHLHVDYDDTSECFTLTGLPDEIDAMEQLLENRTKTVFSITHTLHPHVVSMVESVPEAKTRIESACLRPDYTGKVRFTADGFTVFSLDQDKARAMKTAGQRVVKEEEIQYDASQHAAVTHQDFVDLMESKIEKNRGLMKIVHLEQDMALLCVGVNDSFNTDVRDMKECLNNLRTKKETFAMVEAHQRVFQLLIDSGKILPNIGLTLSVEYRPDLGEVTVTGSEQVLGQVQTAVAVFTERVITQSKEFTKPGLHAFLTSNQGERTLKDAEHSWNCCIALTDQGSGSQRQTSRGWARQEDPVLAALPPLNTRQFLSPDEDDDTSRTDEDSSSSDEEPSVPSRPRVFVKKLSDITKEEHDFLVNSTNTSLDLNQGQVAKALLSVGGDKLQDECRRLHPQGVKMRGIAVTGPGRTREDAKQDGQRRLDCKHIIHCCLPQLSDHDKMTQVVKESVTKCLEKADQLVPEKKSKSIGFPAIGTGTLGYPPSLVAAAMFSAVVQYGKTHPDTCVSDVFFILHKKDTQLTEIFDAAHAQYDQARADSRQKEEDAMYRNLPSQGSTGTRSYPFFEDSGRRVSLEFSGVDQADIDQAVEAVLQVYRDTVQHVAVKLDQLNTWDESFIRQLIMTHRAASVDITFKFDDNEIELRGLRDNIDISLLHTMVTEAETDLQDRQRASITAMQVAWCWNQVDSVQTTLVHYDPLNSYKMEQAYKDNKRSVIIYDRNRTPFFIDFTTMTEKPEILDKDGDCDVIKVVRKDNVIEQAVDVPAPDSWRPLGDKTLDVVPLPRDSREFQQVEHHFLSTIVHASVNIVKIERIQNLTLYKQYHSLKKQMEGRGVQQPEMVPLWHGTSEECRHDSKDQVVATIPQGFNVVESIIKNGFNRSYCNRTNYGEGVYFASTAHYSSEDKYAMRNDQGHRHVFYCRVLVGRYTEGQHDLRIPPKLPDALGFAGSHYDSTVDDANDPKVFVAFHDAQAYPDYLIVFTD